MNSASVSIATKKATGTPSSSIAGEVHRWSS